MSQKEPIAKMPHPNMEYRFLGNSGLTVSVISLGGWLTHGNNAHASNEIAFQTMKRAYDLGVNFFDSAEGYRGGEAEILLGEAIKKFGWEREDLVISTKLYWGERPDGSKGINDLGLSRKHVLGGMKKSLKRLQLDYVDLIYAHRPDKHTPMEEVVRAFNYLINTGQALYWGTSEWAADEITEAHLVAEKLGLIGPLMEQPQYNLLTRDRVEKEYHLLYKRHGLGLTVYSPLARGLLTGKYNNGVPAGSRAAQPDMGWFRKQVDEKKEELQKFATLSSIAKEIGSDVTLSQLALGWVIKNPDVSSAIIGATSVAQLEENFGAINVLRKLTKQQMEKIDEVMGNKPVLVKYRFD